MKFSNNGINVLKQLEGAVIINGKHVVYDDQTGKPININGMLPHGATIGYGHLVQSGECFKGGITEAQATELLRTDVAVAERAVQNNIFAPLSQNQYDALVIFAYNIGINNFAKSTVVKYINNPNFRSVLYPTVELAWRAWNKSAGREMTGLNRRRDAELKLFYTI